MAEIIARVTEEAGKVEGGLVELSNGDTYLNGRVAAESSNEFVVEWSDGARSVENKSDYELVVTTRTASDPEEDELGGEGGLEAREAAENPGQPAGFAVPPMDANAHPNGELMAIEMEKRNETAAWEDAQNRAPIDGENPAQPAGFAVPPASGAPIPGQGADGLMMAARVYANDVSGTNGRVELENGNLRVAGKILAADDENFIVEWEDDRRTVESKADYDLIIKASLNVTASEECARCGSKFDRPGEPGSVCENCAKDFGVDGFETKASIDVIASETHDSWVDIYGDQAFEKTDGGYVCKWCQQDSSEPKTVVFANLGRDAEEHFVDTHLDEMDISPSDYAE